MTFDDAEDFATNNVEHSLPFCTRDCTQTTSHPISGMVAVRRLDIPPNLQELFRALEWSLIGNRGRSESGITGGHDWAEYRGYSGVDGGGDQRAQSKDLQPNFFLLPTTPNNLYLAANRSGKENKSSPLDSATSCRSRNSPGDRAQSGV